jgi:hypothetical protein
LPMKKDATNARSAAIRNAKKDIDNVHVTVYY